MEELEILNLARRNLRRERIFRDRYNPLEWLTDEEFIDNYRLRKQNVTSLLQQGASEEPISHRSMSIPAVIRLCITLSIRTAATFRKTAELLGVSKSSVQLIFWDVVSNLARTAPNFIKFQQDFVSVYQEFYQLGKIPNVIGCVDGTFVPILRPFENEHIYVCRKGFHALNVMVVNSAKLLITYLNPRFPGADHDSFVFKMSALFDFLNGPGIGNGHLLGDSAYGLSQAVLVPITNPSTAKQRKYNREFRRIRCSVERAIGVWKGRWRIIGRYMLTKIYS